MGYRAHVQKKHEIEYNDRCHFNYAQDEIYKWLCENEVDVWGNGNEWCQGDEWEIAKDELRAIPEEAYAAIEAGPRYKISAEELRDFVNECLAAPTGEFAYVSWF